ncbi:hypothetical protein LguiB_010029 [Lonicera macranthoides]
MPKMSTTNTSLSVKHFPLSYSLECITSHLNPSNLVKSKIKPEYFLMSPPPKYVPTYSSTPPLTSFFATTCNLLPPFSNHAFSTIRMCIQRTSN